MSRPTRTALASAQPAGDGSADADGDPPGRMTPPSLGEGMSVGDGAAVGDGDGDGLGAGVALGAAVGFGVGVAVGLGVGVGIGVGDGVGAVIVVTTVDDVLGPSIGRSTKSAVIALLPTGSVESWRTPWPDASSGTETWSSVTSEFVRWNVTEPPPGLGVTLAVQVTVSPVSAAVRSTWSFVVVWV